MSDGVLISAISGLCGIVVAYITVRYKSQRSKPQAKDRIDTAFDMYEGLIKKLNDEIQRKDELITELTLEVKRLEKEIK